ncbi:MAG: hypothetical protein QOD75_3139 [Blastocatellia bacterium]|jgi:uncharacterized protein (DUF488 family)|nr:hypothetical protein [Blastocatellia bacterium]
MEASNELPEIWTVGHSTREATEFIEVLRSCDIETLVDVRTFPGSRRYPQFNQNELAESLGLAETEYVHLPSLGGRRRARKDSTNIAWRNESFRGYADYMETEAFRNAINELLQLAGRKRTVIMCAEAVWWRCHRSLISDYLKAGGVLVIHILDKNKTQLHPYTSAAGIVNGELTYKGLLSEPLG